MWGRVGSGWLITKNVALRSVLRSHGAVVLSLSSATGNDSCGVEADTKFNDTDLCWGPLRRVDAYRIYLVSSRARAPPPTPRAGQAMGGPWAANHLDSLVERFPQRRVCAAPLSG